MAQAAHTFDVIVAGGGPAGIAAALSAARNGASTRLLEQTGALGGMGTNGLVPGFAPYSWGKDEFLIRGVGEEIRRRMLAVDPMAADPWPTIDPEQLKVIYDRLVLDAGCQVRLFSLLTDVEREKSRIKAFVAHSKSGRTRFQARFFVDCTGDADAAFLAGCPTVKGDADGSMQAVSLCLVVAGIDVMQLEAAVRAPSLLTHLREALTQALAAGHLSNTSDFQYRFMMVKARREPGVLQLNFGHIYGIDGTQTEDLTKAMMVGRAHALAFTNFARERIPGMARAWLASTAPLPGIRETRRIQGYTTLEQNAFLDGVTHDDDIAVYDYPPDVHDSTPFRDESTMANPFRRLGEMARHVRYGIPFSALVPQGINNLLVAGRCLAAESSHAGLDALHAGVLRHW